MARKPGIYCDGCQIAKKETNSWWAVQATGSGFLVVAAHDVDPATADQYDDYCGEDCVARAFSKWASKRRKGAAV